MIHVYFEEGIVLFDVVDSGEDVTVSCGEWCLVVTFITLLLFGSQAASGLASMAFDGLL